MGGQLRSSFPNLPVRPIRCAMKEGDKHHYIPKFYLKQWAGSDGRLCEFSMPYDTVKPKRVHPEGTGYEPDLYNFNTLPAPARDTIEKRLFLVADDWASKALQRILVGDLNLDRDTRSGWSRFIMSLFHRNPERIAYLRKQVAEEFPVFVEGLRVDFEKTRDRNDHRTYEEFRASLGPADIERMNLRFPRMILDSPSVGGEINSMEWGTLQFHRLAFPLLTSDRPLVMTNGIKHDHGHIIVPISPDQIFFAARSKKVVEHFDRICKMPGTAAAFNDRIVSQARRFV